MKFFLIFPLLFATLSSAEKIDYDGYKVLRIVPQSDSQLSALKEIQKTDKVDFWLPPRFVNASVDLMVAPKNEEFVNKTLQAANIAPSVLVNNLKDLLFKRETENVMLRAFGKGFSFVRYCRIDDIYQYMEKLAKAKPEIATIHEIGKTFEGRSIKLMKVGKPSVSGKKPAIWLDAGMHAREWIGPPIAMYVLNQLILNYTNHRDLVDEVDWFVLPVTNPDGYEFTHTSQRMWRKTRSKIPSSSCRGTDGNRNFGHYWARGGSSFNPCSEIFHGTSAFSEPETKAIRDTILKYKDSLKVYMSFHAYGQMWLTPWGYTTELPPDYLDLHKLATKATEALQKVYGTKYVIGSSTNVLYIATGGSDDWAKAVAGVKYAYTVEVRDNGQFGFALPAGQILPTVQETWEGLKVVGQEVMAMK